jgi:GTP cyclohydrolase II
LTIYIWGDPETIPDEDIELTCRVHDECNGSDVFGRFVKRNGEMHESMTHYFARKDGN